MANNENLGSASGSVTWTKGAATGSNCWTGNQDGGSGSSADSGLRLGSIGMLYRNYDGPEPADPRLRHRREQPAATSCSASASPRLPPPPTGLVKATEDGRVAVFVEENGDVSFAMGPNDEGKVHYAQPAGESEGPRRQHLHHPHRHPARESSPRRPSNSPPVASSFNIHIVQRGENLYQIASALRRFDGSGRRRQSAR